MNKYKANDPNLFKKIKDNIGVPCDECNNVIIKDKIYYCEECYIKFCRTCAIKNMNINNDHVAACIECSRNYDNTPSEYLEGQELEDFLDKEAILKCWYCGGK